MHAYVCVFACEYMNNQERGTQLKTVSAKGNCVTMELMEAISLCTLWLFINLKSSFKMTALQRSLWALQVHYTNEEKKQDPTWTLGFNLGFLRMCSSGATIVFPFRPQKEQPHLLQCLLQFFNNDLLKWAFL
jgi:hypothetical protein